MEIRSFREADTGEVIRLWHACGLVVPQNDPRRDILRKLGVQGDLFLVGVQDGRVVACVMAGYEGHRGWLNYLAVDPELRRQGLGRRMVQEAERRLAELGCPKINLQVRATNTGVIDFYRRIGYSVDDVVSMGRRLVRDAGPVNDLGQPVGSPLAWVSARPPPRAPMVGRYCTVTPLDPRAHGDDLWAGYTLDREGRNWTYLPYGPFPARDAFGEWLVAQAARVDPLFHAILDPAGRAVGLASYLRIQSDVGVIEVGHLNYTPHLQRKPASTEAMYLMMRRAFDELGYRRYEWKCDALNEPSRRAASRLGFTFEGIFRQATVYKGRNRDTAWFSITDQEWPRISRAFQAWLDPGNFDAQGRQRRALTELREQL